MGELTYVTPGRPRKPKGITARYRAKRRRAEGPVKKAVRAECVVRDGYCRAAHDWELWKSSPCEGPSEWAHMHSRRRSQTRNQAPGVRHDTKHSFMACQKHHSEYDGRQSPRLFVTALTDKGADGPLKFRRGK